MRSLTDTVSVDWRDLKAAFNAAVKALNSPEPLEIAPLPVEWTGGSTGSLKVLDTPITRILYACKPFFPSPTQLISASDRLLALMRLIPQLPEGVLLADSYEDGGNVDDALRDEIFIVAASIRLTRKGAMPLARLLRLVEQSMVKGTTA